MNAKKKNKTLKFLLSFTIVALFVYAFFRYFDTEAVFKILETTKINIFLAALAVHYLSFITKTLRWKILLEGIGVKEKFRHVFYTIFTTFFLNSLAPMRFGDIYRMHMLKKKRALPITKSAGILFIEKVIDIFFLIFALFMAGLFLFESNPPYYLKYVQLAGLFIAVSLSCALALLFFSGKKISALIPKRLSNMLDNFKEALKDCSRITIMLPVLIFTLIDWAIAFLFFYMIALALGVQLPAAWVIFIVTISEILSTIPITPAGLGFVESGVAGILLLIGLDRNLSISIALLDRIVVYWLQIVFGLVIYFSVKSFSHKKLIPDKS